jgi:hypothetical protein
MSAAVALEKRSGLEKLTIPYFSISSSLFLEATDLSSAGICAPSQCVDFTQDDYTVSMVINICPRPTTNAYVVFTGGQAPDASGTLAKRFFHRLTWKPANAHVISVSDPIHFTDKFLNLGFYAMDIFGPMLIPTLLNKLCALLTITDACVTGGCGGSWVSLKFLSENYVPAINRCVTLSGLVNPLLTRLNGSCKRVETVLNAKIAWDISMPTLQGRCIWYIQNELDEHFFTTQFKHFAEELRAAGSKLFLYNTPPEVILADHHYYGLSQRMIEGIFRLMNSETPSAEEQAELDRHRFRPY